MKGRRAGGRLWAIGLAACIALFFMYLFSPVARAKESVRAERALLVGIDNFVSRPSAYPSSTNNVYAMQEAFQSSERPMRMLLIPQEPVVDEQGLTKLIQHTFQDAGDQDVSYLYISTHGVYDPFGGEEPALLLSDGQREGRITPAQLEAAFNGIRGTKVLLLDACNSGAFIGKGMAAQPLETFFLGEDFKVITSSGALEESWYWNAADLEEPQAGTAHEGTPQGAFYFTQALSQGLNPRYGYPADRNHDGSITLSELYDYLMESHAASTPQVYPQQDEFVVFRYDLEADVSWEGVRAPILDICFSDTILSRSGHSITLEYIATRPVRVAYQIVYQQDGKWIFDEAQLLYDDVERFTAYGDQLGVVSAGRKVRTLSVNLEAVDAYGYVMVQVVSIDQGRLTVHAGRVLCVPPVEGELNLAVDVAEVFNPSGGKEASIFVEHSYPCALSVAVEDVQGNVVRRLCHRSSTRPAQTDPAGSLFYWNGTDKAGQPVPSGLYRVHVTGTMNEHSFQVQSQEIMIVR